MSDNGCSSEWGAVLFSLSVMTWSSVRNFLKFQHYEDAYVTERRGRIRVEKEMKNIRQVRLQTGQDGGGAFFVQPIGYVESCYKQCIGTPRQGHLVPSSRSIIHLQSNISPEALDGLEGFSHVWLTFKFHLNTNTLDEAKAFQGVEGSKQKFTFTAKITPPMLKKKVGVLSTRSPHRPNPIGITLAKIDKVVKKDRCLHVTSCDLVQNTPILDIKPYVSKYDCAKDDRIPDWILNTIDTRNEVTVASNIVEESLQCVNSFSRLYKNDHSVFWKGVIETLEADVRSKFQTKKAIEGHEKKQVFDLPFDLFNIRYEWKGERMIEIVSLDMDSERAKSESKRIGMYNLKNANSKQECDTDTVNIEDAMKTCRVAKRFLNGK